MKCSKTEAHFAVVLVSRQVCIGIKLQWAEAYVINDSTTNAYKNNNFSSVWKTLVLDYINRSPRNANKSSTSPLFGSWVKNEPLQQGVESTYKALVTPRVHYIRLLDGLHHRRYRGWFAQCACSRRLVGCFNWMLACPYLRIFLRGELSLHHQSDGGTPDTKALCKPPRNFHTLLFPSCIA